MVASWQGQRSDDSEIVGASLLDCKGCHIVLIVSRYPNCPSLCLRSVVRSLFAFNTGEPSLVTAHNQHMWQMSGSATRGGKGSNVQSPGVEAQFQMTFEASRTIVAQSQSTSKRESA